MNKKSLNGYKRKTDKQKNATEKVDLVYETDMERMRYNEEHGTSYSYGMYRALRRAGQL